MVLHYLLPVFFFTLKNYYLEKEMQNQTDDWRGVGGAIMLLDNVRCTQYLLQMFRRPLH